MLYNERLEYIHAATVLIVPRNITADYQDPADLIWLQAASRLRIAVVRSASAYASWDGRGTLTLASREYLDDDDCLAQMIFHELCHLLVSGEQARAHVDWGLDNTSPRDLVYEYATNRLQAALAGGYGLRRFMAVTTVWREYYDQLPDDPLMPANDPAATLAADGLSRARSEPYRKVLHEALSATEALAGTLRPLAPHDSLWNSTQDLHVTGFRLHPDPACSCGECAWAIGNGQGSISCRLTRPGCGPADYRLHQTPAKLRQVRFAPNLQACDHFEPQLDAQDCLGCGACCRRGFDVVEVSAREMFARRHPDLIEVRSEDRCVVPRPDGRCVVLIGDGSTSAPFRCRHYDERPRSCRNFALAGDACLLARRRCGVRKPLQVS